MKNFNMISIIIILIITCCNLINAQTYINFVPQKTKDLQYSQCSNEVPQGYGYSILVGYCFTLDNKFSHQITSDGNSYLHSLYYMNGDTNSTTADCTGEPLSTSIIKEESCIEPILFNSNSYQYYLNAVDISIVQGSTSVLNSVPRNSYINSLMENQCDNDHIAVLEYMISGTFSYIGQNIVTYACNAQNQPTVQTCNDSAPFCPRSATIINNVNCLQISNSVYNSVFCKN